MRKIWLLVLLTLFPINALAKTVPCVEQDRRGRWRISSTEMCIQHNRKEAVALAREKIELSSLRLEVGKLKLKLQKKDFIIHQWSVVRFGSWRTQLSTLSQQVEVVNTRALHWKGVAEHWKGVALSKKEKWWKHPAIWSAIGAALGGGLVYLGNRTSQ